MMMTKVLIKFISPHHVGNVVGGIALEPEILVPVGYGAFLTEAMRSRYNYFFYHRRLQTVLTDPVRLERYMEADIEAKLEELLSKYAAARPVVDISDADAQQAMALGSVLRGHPNWVVGVLDYRLRDGIFFPLKNADNLKRLPFPTLTAAEFRFLRYGTSFDAETEKERISLARRDLDKSTVRLIRALARVYSDRPAFWRDAAEKLRRTAVGLVPGKREYLIDAAQLPVRDEAFEELVERGILSRYVKKNGIVNLVFPEMRAAELLLRIDRVPVLNIFLTVALVREYGQAAAYRDLSLVDYEYVTGIRFCTPLILGVYRELGGVQEICRFCSDTAALYEEPVRRILVKETGLPVPEEDAAAAENLGVEIVDFNRLEETVTPA